MMRILLSLGVVGLLGAGCATSNTNNVDTRAQAMEHQRRADDLAARGDLRGAQKEQRKADRLSRQATVEHYASPTYLPSNEKRLDDASYPEGELPNFYRPPEVRE